MPLLPKGEGVGHSLTDEGSQPAAIAGGRRLGDGAFGQTDGRGFAMEGSSSSRGGSLAIILGMGLGDGWMLVATAFGMGRKNRQGRRSGLQ